MSNWKQLNNELIDLLQLDSQVIAVKRMDKKEDLKNIPGLENLKALSHSANFPTW